MKGDSPRRLEQRSAAQRSYYRKHRHRILAQEKAKYAANPTAKREQAKRWHHANKDQAKTIARRNHLRRAYGINEEEYSRMLIAAAGRCEICGDAMTTPHIDHCHNTGRVRGLLCETCNLHLGIYEMLYNNPRVKDYLGEVDT